MAATAAILLQSAAIAAIVRVVIQPDGGSPAPGPVDLSVERKVLLPTADRDPAPAVLCHGGVVEADRRALLQQAGVGCSAEPSYVDNLVQDAAADAGFERTLFDQIHRSTENLGEVTLKSEKPEDPRHLGELDQEVHVASLVLLATPARAEDANGPDVIGLLQVSLVPSENADDPRALPTGLAGDGIHS